MRYVEKGGTPLDKGGANLYHECTRLSSCGAGPSEYEYSTGRGLHTARDVEKEIMMSAAFMNGPALTPAPFDKITWLENVCPKPFDSSECTCFCRPSFGDVREWTRSRRGSMSFRRSTKSDRRKVKTLLRCCSVSCVS